MERAHSRLQTELERYKDINRDQEDLRENRLQVDQLQEQADRLTAELSSLQTAHNALRLLSSQNVFPHAIVFLKYISVIEPQLIVLSFILTSLKTPELTCFA